MCQVPVQVLEIQMLAKQILLRKCISMSLHYRRGKADNKQDKLLVFQSVFTMILLRNTVIWYDLNFKVGCVKGFWKQNDMLGMVAYACDTSTWEMELEGQEFKVTVRSMGITVGLGRDFRLRY